MEDIYYFINVYISQQELYPDNQTGFIWMVMDATRLDIAAADALRYDFN